MKLNSIGLIIDYHINNFPTHWSSIDLHEYIIMPNHIHLLMVIGEGNRPVSQQEKNIIKDQKCDISDIGRAEITSLQKQKPP
jgi:REP element-mobilizing transposase RayT